MPRACNMRHENRCMLCLTLNGALLSQMCFYLSGSVFTPITGLNLSKTLLAANSIVPSPTEKQDVSFTFHSNPNSLTCFAARITLAHLSVFTANQLRSTHTNTHTRQKEDQKTTNIFKAKHHQLNSR